MKSIDIKGKSYIEVNERLKEFRTNNLYKGYSLESDLVQLDNGVCTFKATIKDETGRVIATGFAQEKENSSFINKTSFIENCETSAWGRALGNLGIGIDTSIASADEVLNAMENQKSKASKKKEDLNADFDIIAGLAAIEDVANLKLYWQQNENKVIDKDAFIEACKRRKEVIV